MTTRFNAVILGLANAVILGLVPRTCDGRPALEDAEPSKVQMSSMAGRRTADPRDKPEDDGETANHWVPA